MSRLPDLADRIERLLLRHEEQKRTNALLEQQLRAVTDERDNLRSRLAAARARIDALIDRLPPEAAAAEGTGEGRDAVSASASAPGHAKASASASAEGVAAKRAPRHTGGEPE
jgi:uncharacterized protein (TIGR02449 family)